MLGSFCQSGQFSYPFCKFSPNPKLIFKMGRKIILSRLTKWAQHLYHLYIYAMEIQPTDTPEEIEFKASFGEQPLRWLSDWVIERKYSTGSRRSFSDALRKLRSSLSISGQFSSG